MLLGTRPALRYCDPEAQPQPQQSRPTTSDNTAATPTEAATHTSHHHHPARKISTGIKEKDEALSGHAKEEKKVSLKGVD
ncbi:hypothetical protein NDU88_002557 [Pleurodeles waltl]|uniref:Uncharacterized protein n=1 Tax=Pleurodeles waltl TaxID=8319 RepID=A0AAV7MPS7_PLEWA|nr:hypothetical protein NDU88_002557 [Pleurodeles waltl]